MKYPGQNEEGGWPFRTRGGCSYNPRVIPCRSTAGSPDRPGANGVPSTPKCATPFAPVTGAPTNPKRDAPPVGAPPPVRTACPARPNAPPHIAPVTSAPTNPKHDAPPVGAPPPVRTACPARPNAPSHIAPDTGAPTSGAPL